MRLSILALCLALPVAGCSNRKSEPAESHPTPSDSLAAVGAGAAERINPRLLRRFQVLPNAFTEGGVAPDAELANLGRALYYDVRLSEDGDMSCNSCHDLARYGVDRQVTSPGHLERRGTRNAPTVYNAAGFFAQFWDGRAPNVEEQAKVPILNPVEMAMGSADDVEAVLRAIPSYADAFHRAFPGESDPITFDNVGKAIGAFERGLVTPGRWDRFLRGEVDALNRDEKVGLKTFLDVGCMVCHTGPLLGGSMFERAGAVEPWPNRADKGRGDITHSAADDMMFKVPTLRNVEMTAPYFHDGSAATLDEAVAVMGRRQLGIELTPGEVRSIVTWLGSLTGEIPTAYVQPSALAKR